MEELIQTLFPDGTVSNSDGHITVNNLSTGIVPLNCDILMYVMWGDHEREFYLLETEAHGIYLRISLTENNPSLKYALIHSTMLKTDPGYQTFIQDRTEWIQLAIDMKNAGQIRTAQ